MSGLFLVWLCFNVSAPDFRIYNYVYVFLPRILVKWIGQSDLIRDELWQQKLPDWLCSIDRAGIYEN